MRHTPADSVAPPPHSKGGQGGWPVRNQRQCAPKSAHQHTVPIWSPPPLWGRIKVGGRTRGFGDSVMARHPPFRHPLPTGATGINIAASASSVSLASCLRGGDALHRTRRLRDLVAATYDFAGPRLGGGGDFDVNLPTGDAPIARRDGVAANPKPRRRIAGRRPRRG